MPVIQPTVRRRSRDAAAITADIGAPIDRHRRHPVRHARATAAIAGIAETRRSRRSGGDSGLPSAADLTGDGLCSHATFV
jgi:hypothetical protein